MRSFYPLLPASLCFPVGMVFLDSPVVRLVWSTLGLLFLLKLGALIRNRQNSLPLPRGIGWFCFLFLWPGMRPEVFTDRRFLAEPVGRDFVWGFCCFVSGLLLQCSLSYWWNFIPSVVRLYLGLFTFFLLLHLGLVPMLFAGIRIFGFPVEPLFRNPFASESLRDFWGKRWNLAFVDMDKRLFLPLFSKNWGKGVAFLGIFLVSGLLHEIGISYPAGGGWGLPLAYFLLHGALSWVEPSLPVLNKYYILRRIWVWAALIGPLPLLMHQPFLRAFLEPYFSLGHEVLRSFTSRELLHWAILASGCGHLLILVASVQVPGKLHWREDFQKLSRFNQKIFWTYGGYIVFCILAFAAVDLLEATALLEAHPSSLAIALFIALFWTARVLIDFIYFRHDDWPEGDIFVIGHALLTALFVALALAHWSLVVWHWMGNP